MPAPHAPLAALAALSVFLSCGDGTGPEEDRDYRQDMRDFVLGIAGYARAMDADFLVTPQNGHDLFTLDGDPEGPPAMAYLSAIDGAGREDLFYGYVDDDGATPAAARSEMTAFLDVAEAAGVEALVTDSLAPAHLRLAEIHEQLDQPDAAAEHYARFLELWRDCHPELQPTVDRAERRLERLRADETGSGVEH